MSSTDSLTSERADLVVSLDRQRGFLKRTARGLTDEQAAMRTTVSELCVGGLIKHVTMVERQWARFIVEGPSAMRFESGDPEAFKKTFRMLEGETLAALIDGYDEVGKQTDDLVRSLPDLDAAQPLPQAPWFEPGASWSARRVILHVISETSQHSGHADIIREALDGAKTMG